MATRSSTTAAAATALCPACEFGPFTRNAYWTGKLMLARDFVDEQRYVIDKLRHHNQQLHGSGVVCGLKVVQHDKEACRDRFVCVEPGTAIDCCGHDIMVREQDCLDLWAVPAIKALRERTQPTRHRRAHPADLHPLPRMRDRAHARAVRRVRLRRRQVRAQPDPRVVRARRASSIPCCRRPPQRCRHSAAISGRRASRAARTAISRTAWCWRRSRAGASATRSSNGPPPPAAGGASPSTTSKDG